MPSLEEELQQIQSLTDTARVQGKKTSRKGQLTKLGSQLRTLGDTTFADMRPSDVEKKLKEAIRSTTLFTALQERHEALLLEAGADNLEEEISIGQNIRDENEKIVEKAELLMEKLTLYDEGVVLVEAFRELLLTDNIDRPVYQKEFSSLREQAMNLKRKTRCFSGDPEISHNNAELTRSIKNFQIQLAEAQEKSDTSSETSSVTEVRPISSSFSKLTLELPKYSGKPVDWSSFKTLFTSVMDNQGVGMPDSDRCCHLLKAMTTEETRKVVDLAAKGKDGYKKAFQALEDAFGRPNLVYPHHVQSLLKSDAYTYDRRGLRRMRETIEYGIRGLESCDGYTIEQFLAAIITDRFDEQMSHEWTTHTAGSSKLPKIQDLVDFFKKREFSMKDAPPPKSSKPSQSKKTQSTTSSTTPLRQVHRVTSTSFRCPTCSQEGHPISRCPTFLGWSPDRRQKAVKEARHCFNCLSHAHVIRECQSTFTCRHCGAKHHTLLHKDTPATTNTDSGANVDAANDDTTVLHVDSLSSALLSTAVSMATNGEQQQKARALLDSGASISLITERLASNLNLKRHPQRLNISGVTGSSVSRHFVYVNLASVHPVDVPDSIIVKCHVVSDLKPIKPPSNPTELLNLPCIRGRSPVADPALGGSIDLILGIADCGRCTRGPPSSSEDRATIATPTVFGWTLGGAIPDSSLPTTILRVQGKEDPLDQSLQRLWTLDQTPDNLPPRLSPEEEDAMAQFRDTHQVLPDGRFSVKLPRCDSPPTLGASRPTALRRFLQNERSLKAKGKLSEFEAVLQEYLALDHAEEIPKTELAIDHSISFYLPVHGVVKDSSTTTRLRAVFDASAKTTSGASLNDLLLPGPNLYPLLATILTKFRLHTVAVSADISKMFREVVLDISERDYHRFLIRNAEGAITDCRMKRLTFGVKSSPYLATQVLLQLADRKEKEYPLAADVIRTCFYVDDCLAGASTVQEAALLCHQLCDLLASAGMTLRKWRSNSQDLLETIPEHLREAADLKITDPLSSSKALGIHWHVPTDQFHVAVPEVPADVSPTKRSAASITAKVFDVLGLFSPATITAKILLQQMWKLHLDWDDEVPEDIASAWLQWVNTIPTIASHPVSRRLVPLNYPILSQQIHGFADASANAYGAVLYLRTVYQNAEVSVVLITSKARVAPVKPVTIPRLELTAAYLLAKLIQVVTADLNIPIQQTYAWTDSSIVLSWLHSSPTNLKIFVANRVAAIQDIIASRQWRHVRSKDNPADLASRGVSPSELVKSILWWEGPPWLKSPPSEWPHLSFNPMSEPTIEIKANVCSVTVTKEQWDLWTRFSSFSHLTRVLAWILRFYSNVQKSKEQRNLSTVLSSTECSEAKQFILRKAQQETYQDVFDLVQADRSLPPSHSLGKFNVSIGPDDLLRIGGRVRDQNLPHLSKTFVPLSLKSSISKLFVRSLHATLLHPGISTMLATLAENYYIPGIKNYLKLISRSCSICQRAYGRPTNQKMGLLPPSRTIPAPPFDHTGVDFAGPFLIHRGNPRKPVRVKVYAVIFVCFSTRAVHLEACSDLSSQAFLATLHRFCARRGTPSHLSSDNGTNFVGAKGEIEEVQAMLNHDKTRQGISHMSASRGMQWHFSPPRAPHFGGLWEAGVKAMKTLLRKLITPRPLSFEELSTVLTEVEAILNSRPLTPLASTEPDDNSVLTAGHFIIGRPLIAPPPVQIDTTSQLPLLRRWNLVRRLNHDLWINWKSRYLQSLTARAKWHRPCRNYRVGDIVLIKDEMITHRDWPLARVIRTFPGTDGLVRTVELRCQNRTYKRSTNQLVLLVED